MPPTKQILTATRCFRCQRSTLDRFIGLTGIQVGRCHQDVVKKYGTLLPRRHFSNTVQIRAEALSDQPNRALQYEGEQHQVLSEVDEVETQDVMPEEPEIEALENVNSESNEVPWYLQEQEDISPETSLTERQRLPAIPEDAPKNFSAILQRLSLDIGLDYIRLIDLRELDPPPALGSSVMMLIGTARSEKHLHVSADRFARWLRSEYKLSPNADGLLGRNELKLKLRRKAKRAKLLGSVGAVQREDEDDGTKTNWVCVDAGVIEPASTVTRSLDDIGIIGFGGQSDGVKLVVQMMTEDKRRELDLETLWERALERYRRRVAAREAAMAEASQQIDGEDQLEQQDQRRSS